MNASFDQLCCRISDLLQARGRLAVALDGCCASGKTTLARRLARELEADVVPMDDFFLPPKLRMPDRLSQPGGNVHYERFSIQIIDPLLAAKRAGGKKAHRPANAGRCSHGTVSTAPSWTSLRSPAPPPAAPC